MMTRLEDLALRLINNKVKKARDLFDRSYKLDESDSHKGILWCDGIDELEEIIEVLTEYESNGTNTRM